jgi:MYXO-CTERM domain-containing protein
MTYDFTAHSIHVRVPSYSHPATNLSARFEFVTVPEPAALVLGSVVLVGLARRRRR